MSGWLLPLAAGITVFVGLFVVLRALRSPEVRLAPTQYDETSRQAFLRACGSGAGAGSAPVCSCAYERLIATVPYAQYLELEAQVRKRHPAATTALRGTPVGSNPSGTVADAIVPDALETILVDCVAYNRQLGAPPAAGGPGGGPPGTLPGGSTPGTLSLSPG